MFGLFGKKCDFCGKPVKGKGVSALGLTFCCTKDKNAYAKAHTKAKGKVIKGKVCEYC
ncbi:MAG: hypothetical protein HYS81_03150 [Candidatus Aenigmatarchaeota archaeon]|nr:MAG: hypothetical protein HYS81_03150 [Candidatus Aenigmarchaeota archaeon]